MTFLRVLLFSLFTSLAISISHSGASAATKTLRIGVPNWPSAQATAHLIEELIATKYNQKVELAPLGSLSIFVGMDAGSVHIHPEIWQPGVSDLVRKYSTEKGSVTLAGQKMKGEQNICVTKQTAELTGIKSVTDLANPEMAKKFDSDNDGKGEIWIGAKAWPSTRIERVRARTYGYDKTMQLLRINEDVAMASVDAAAAIGRPVVFYCYQPHHIFKLHDIVKLDEEPHDPDRWNIVSPLEDPAWLMKSKAMTGWKSSIFQIGYATTLKKDFPKIASFLNQIELTSSDLIAMSYALTVERQDPQSFAKQWIAANQDRVKGWMK